MANTFNNTANEQGLVQHLRFITGQDALSIEDATRLLNFALDDYSYMALTSDGRWKFDDTTHVDGQGNETFPIATTTLSSGEESVPLMTDFLMLNQVQVEDDNGKMRVVEPTDPKDHKHEVLSTKYNKAGMPEEYDYDSRSLFFYPNSDRDRTVKILYSRPSPYFSTGDTTVEIGIPRIHHEYLVLHAAHRLGLRTNDSNREQIRAELKVYEEKIRDFYSRRDEDTPNKLRGSVPSVFMGRSRPR